METKIDQKYKVKVGRTELLVPHEDREIIFISPSKGPGIYTEVMKQIIGDKLNVPTGDYTASLIHGVYCGPEEFRNEGQIKNIREIMKNTWLWVANKNLWTPEGVYVVQDEKGIGRSEELGQGKLEKSLENGETIKRIRFSEDRRVRFAPKDTYWGGKQSPEDLSKNGFVIASYGVEGAKKLGEVSTQFSLNPYVCGLNIKEGQDPELRVSALYEDDDRWHVDGYFDDDLSGHAFGVLRLCRRHAKIFRNL